MWAMTSELGYFLTPANVSEKIVPLKYWGENENHQVKLLNKVLKCWRTGFEWMYSVT